MTAKGLEGDVRMCLDQYVKGPESPIGGHGAILVEVLTSRR